MSTINNAVLDSFGFTGAGMQLFDNLSAVTTTTSNLTGATPRVPGTLNRYTISPATATVVLPSLLSGEANWPVIVVNDGANTITVYAYADNVSHAESIGGTASTFGGATGGKTVAAGASAIFIPEDVPRGRAGVATANNTNWSAASFT